MAAWLASPGHRANLERPGFGAIGIGVAAAGTTLEWVQDFGDAADAGSLAPVAPVAPPAPATAAARPARPAVAATRPPAPGASLRARHTAARALPGARVAAAHVRAALRSGRTYATAHTRTAGGHTAACGCTRCARSGPGASHGPRRLGAGGRAQRRTCRCCGRSARRGG